MVVSFLNVQVGYAVGKSNTILKTTDGGATWKRLLERQDRVDFQSINFTTPVVWEPVCCLFVMDRLAEEMS